MRSSRRGQALWLFAAAIAPVLALPVLGLGSAEARAQPTADATQTASPEGEENKRISAPPGRGEAAKAATPPGRVKATRVATPPGGRGSTQDDDLQGDDLRDGAPPKRKQAVAPPGSAGRRSDLQRRRRIGKGLRWAGIGLLIGAVVIAGAGLGVRGAAEARCGELSTQCGENAAISSVVLWITSGAVAFVGSGLTIAGVVVESSARRTARVADPWHGQGFRTARLDGVWPRPKLWRVQMRF
ncbi:MAG: hypothetical protein ABI333_05780 [bacterium]